MLIFIRWNWWEGVLIFTRCWLWRRLLICSSLMKFPGSLAKHMLPPVTTDFAGCRLARCYEPLIIKIWVSKPRFVVIGTLPSYPTKVAGNFPRMKKGLDIGKSSLAVALHTFLTHESIRKFPTEWIKDLDFGKSSLAVACRTFLPDPTKVAGNFLQSGCVPAHVAGDEPDDQISGPTFLSPFSRRWVYYNSVLRKWDFDTAACHAYGDTRAHTKRLDIA